MMDEHEDGRLSFRPFLLAAWRHEESGGGVMTNDGPTNCADVIHGSSCHQLFSTPMLYFLTDSFVQLALQ
jgi:hypothetical protein